MQPLHDLLNRVRWDEEFGRARFELGYHDRFVNELLYVVLSDLKYERPDDESFVLVDTDGNRRTIPFHRVRRVVRDGVLIWSRDR